MNTVALIGRLTKDPQVYSGETMVARFTLAVDRPVKAKDGKKLTDWPAIVCFGKQAEFAEKYLTQGRQIGIEGRLQTGSYDKDGEKVYTTEVICERITFCGSKSDKNDEKAEDEKSEKPSGFVMTEEDIPF